jgi:hypothetical protein
MFLSLLRFDISALHAPMVGIVGVAFGCHWLQDQAVCAAALWLAAAFELEE